LKENTIGFSLISISASAGIFNKSTSYYPIQKYLILEAAFELIRTEHLAGCAARFQVGF